MVADAGIHVCVFLHGHVSGFGGTETHIRKKVEDNLNEDEGRDGLRNRVLVKAENVELLLARELASGIQLIACEDFARELVP